MKQTKKMISAILVLILVLGLPMQAFANQGKDQKASLSQKNVTFRIEYLEATLQATKDLTVDYKTFSEYGLPSSLNDPGYITPMHILAEYFEKEFANAGGVGNIDAPGYLKSIMGSEGSIEGDGPCGWMFMVNNKIPSEDGLGYTITDYPVKDGDQVVIFGIWYSFDGKSTSYNTFFDHSHYTAETGEPINIKLLGREIFDYDSSEALPIAGAAILADVQDNPDSFALENTGFITDKNGIAQVSFETAGTYVLSAARKNAGGHTDISRPYAVVNVNQSSAEADQQLVQDDKTALAIPSETTKDLELPQKGLSGKTTISWQSSEPSVINNAGKITRPDADKQSADVTLTATIKKGAASVTKQFNVSVLPYTQLEVLADIGIIKSAMGSSYTATESKDTNIIAPMQAKADAAILGSRVTIVSSLNTQVNGTTGEITYGTSRKTGNVTLNIALSGVTEQYTLSVVIPAHQKSAQEIVNEDADKITWESIRNSNTDINAVKSSLKSLPSTGNSYCTDISWEISHPEIISRYGSITRPFYGNADAEVTLTATVAANADYMAMFGYTGTSAPVVKTMQLTVLAYTQEEYNAAEADLLDVIAKLSHSDQYSIKYFYDESIADLDDVTGDFNLNVPSSVLNGAGISWSSTNPAITINTYYASVTRPLAGQPEVTGTLTATLTKSGNQKTVNFNVTIRPLSEEEINAENAFLNKVKEELTFAKIKGQNVDDKSVMANMSMVYRGMQDNDTITWKTSNSGYNGAIVSWETNDSAAAYAYETKRPAVGQPNKQVTLTATISSQKIRNASAVPAVQKQITYTVLAYSNSLTNISLSEGRLSTDFDPDTTSYNGIEIPRGTQKMDITIAKQDPDAAVNATGAKASETEGVYTVDMDENPKTVTFEVKRNNITKIYHVNLYPSPIDLPDYNGEWDSFRGNTSNNGITNIKTARSMAEADLQWSLDLVENPNWLSSAGAPLIVNDHIYIAADNEIKIIDKKGLIQKTGILADKIGFNCNMAYGNGMLFVPINNGRIQALNAQTLESLWISEDLGENYQAGCPVLYKDGYIYSGSYSYISSTKTNGSFFCIDVNDDNPYTGDEVKHFKWTYTSGNDSLAGYYWAGAAIAGNALLFGGDDGNLISYSLDTGDVIDTFDAESGSIRCSVLYKDSSAYFATSGGKAFCVPVNANGTFTAGQVKSTELSNGASTSTPVLYNGRLYAISGSFTTGGKLDVINANTMERISSADIGGYSQSSPLITTAYATEQNGRKVYLYMMLNDAADDVVCIEDSEMMNTPIVNQLFSPGSAYASASLIADTAGSLYFSDGNFKLNALANKKIEIKGISLEDSKITLKKGESKDLVAAIDPVNAPDRAVTWKSNNPLVASVDTSGRVTAQSPGTAMVTVATMDGGHESYCEVTVEQEDEKTYPVTGVVLNQSLHTMNVKETFKLTATVQPENAENKAVIWISDNTSAATVVDGQVKAIAPGTAVITVKTEDGGYQDSCKITVKQPVVSKVLSVKMPQKTVYIKKGKRITITAAAYTNDGSAVKLRYSRGNKKIVSVSQKGLIKGLKVGTTTVTAKAKNGKKATIKVKVLAKEVKLKRISIGHAPKTIYMGTKNKFLSAKWNPVNATGVKVKWRSNNKNVLGIDKVGKLTPGKAGKAVITLYAGKKKKSVNILVKALQGTPAPATSTPVPLETPVPSAKISCTVSVECIAALNANTALGITIPNGGIILQDKMVSVDKGGTVYDALVATGVRINGSANYIIAIGPLGEGDYGPGSGWMYSVNGVYLNISAGQYTLHEGDIIQWRYTCNQGKDIGA